MANPTPERAHLRLVVPARSEAEPLSIERSLLLRAQSPEGRTLLEARAAAAGMATLICGVPGSGKSSLLRLLIEDDIRNGTGVLLVDPHGDLVDDLLAGFPAAPQLRRRLVLFVLGWIFQFIGHSVYEHKQPAFFRNFAHLLVGPLWILNDIVPVVKRA